MADARSMSVSPTSDDEASFINWSSSIRKPIVTSPVFRCMSTKPEIADSSYFEVKTNLHIKGIRLFQTHWLRVRHLLLAGSQMRALFSNPSWELLATFVPMIFTYSEIRLV